MCQLFFLDTNEIKRRVILNTFLYSEIKHYRLEFEAGLSVCWEECSRNLFSSISNLCDARNDIQLIFNMSPAFLMLLLRKKIPVISPVSPLQFQKQSQQCLKLYNLSPIKLQNSKAKQSKLFYIQ